MTTEERIAIIRNKAKRDEEEYIEAISAEERQRNELIAQVNNLNKRIEALITLANECVNNGIGIPERDHDFGSYDTAKKYGYDAEFIAEGIRHHTGFIRTWPWYKTGNFVWVGIENGGACGCYDFYTNGDEVFSIHEENHSKEKPRIRDMQKFLKEFPVFEKAFYNWIDSLA